MTATPRRLWPLEKMCQSSFYDPLNTVPWPTHAMCAAAVEDCIALWRDITGSGARLWRPILTTATEVSCASRSTVLEWRLGN